MKPRMPDPIAIERRNRIRLAVAAWAYEVADDPVMTDDKFDALAQSINPWMSTGNLQMDVFFATHFTPHSGAWVRKHPNKAVLALIVGAFGDQIRKRMMSR